MKKTEQTSWKEVFRIHWRAFKDVHRICPKLFVTIIGEAIATAIVPYVTIYFSAHIIDELAGMRRPEILWKWVLITVITEGILALLKAGIQHYGNVQQKVFKMHKERLYIEKMFSMDFADVDKQETHDLLSQIKQNEQWFSWGIYNLDYSVKKFAETITGIISAVLLSVSLFTLPVPEQAGKLVILNHPLFVVLLLFFMMAISAVSGYCGGKAISSWSGVSDVARFGNRIFNAYAFLGEDRDRAEDIRIYNQQDIAKRYLTMNNSFGSDGPIARIFRGPAGVYRAVSTGIPAVFTGMVYVFTCLKAWGGAFGIGSVTQYVSAITSLSQNVSELLTLLGNIKTNTEYLQKTYEFLDIPNAMYQGSLTTEKRADRKYEVEFKNVSFQYPGTDIWALRHVNVKFEVGKRLAVVGENGSGKTTFIKLLCRLYDPQEGQILLNGIDIRKYNYRDYMNIFSVVFQDFQLLSQPLGDNVAGGRNFDSEKVLQALRDAGFADRLSQMPEGLGTVLYKDYSEKGVEVSGGEAQKIAISRALYKDAPFLILDEPTAALDPIAEAEIYTQLNQIVGDKTAVYISHRLSSCRFCDEIMVFDNGRIVQQGSHDELLMQEKGKYYALWHAQAQYYTNN